METLTLSRLGVAQHRYRALGVVDALNEDSDELERSGRGRPWQPLHSPHPRPEPDSRARERFAEACRTRDSTLVPEPGCAASWRSAFGAAAETRLSAPWASSLRGYATGYAAPELQPRVGDHLRSGRERNPADGRDMTNRISARSCRTAVCAAHRGRQPAAIRFTACSRSDGWRASCGGTSMPDRRSRLDPANMSTRRCLPIAASDRGMLDLLGCDVGWPARSDRTESGRGLSTWPYRDWITGSGYAPITSRIRDRGDRSRRVPAAMDTSAESACSDGAAAEASSW